MHTHGALTLANATDARRIAELSRDEVERGLPWTWNAARVLRCIGDDATNVVVASDAGGLNGFGIMRYGDEHAHLLLLAVRPSHRRRGVGTALLGWLETSARVAGLVSMRLELRASNESAQAFYGSLGFTPSGRLRGYYQGTEDALRMRRALRDNPPPST